MEPLTPAGSIEEFTPTHELRDPVAGLIRMSELERRVLDSRPVQRLRRIRQLAMADLVYPGCVHNRFTHALGTMAVADAIWTGLDARRALPPNVQGDRQLVRLAALLHDVGHGPFSHVSEYVLEQHSSASLSGIATNKLHEQVTADVILKDPDLAAVVPEPVRKAIADLLSPSGLRDFRRDIVTSGLDADKLDYLRRDSYFAGVTYGFFDLDKILESFTILHNGPESFLGIHSSGRHAVEQLVLAKWHMTHQVYAHRVRVITDAMIVRGLEEGIKNGNEALESLYSYSQDSSFLERYLRYNDENVISEAMSGVNNEPHSRSIFERLSGRTLYKEIAVFFLDNMEFPDQLDLEHFMKIRNQPDLLKQKEEELAAVLGCEPWEAIILPKSIRNPAYANRDDVDPEAIQVWDQETRLVRLLQSYENRDMPLMSSAKRSADRIHVISPSDDVDRHSASARQRRERVKEALAAR